MYSRGYSQNKTSYLITVRKIPYLKEVIKCIVDDISDNFYLFKYICSLNCFVFYAIKISSS